MNGSTPQDAFGPAVAGSALVAVGLFGRRLGRITRTALTISGGYLAAKSATGNEQVRRSLGLSASQPGGGSRPVRAAVTILTSPEEAYRRWRRLEDLPRWMSHLESVTELDETRSRWRAKAPLGTEAVWEAELTEDRSGEVIAWRSLPGAAIANEGVVRFRSAPGDRGTEVQVQLSYAPPAGPIGVAAKLTGEEPGIQVRDALRRFKQIVETGETATTDGQPSGREPEAVQTDTATRGAAKMGERTDSGKDKSKQKKSTGGPDIVREDEMTQGTQVKNLPHSENPVDEASEESFPASDPPAYSGRCEDETSSAAGSNS